MDANAVGFLLQARAQAHTITTQLFLSVVPQAQGERGFYLGLQQGLGNSSLAVL